MSFVFSILAIVAIGLIIAKLEPEENSFLLIEAVLSKRLSQGKISFAAKRLAIQPQQRPAQGHDAASGSVILMNVQLSSLAQVVSKNSKPAGENDFTELASRLLVDSVAVDKQGNVVAALVVKSDRSNFILEVLRSAGIRASCDQSSFDAQLERIDDN